MCCGWGQKGQCCGAVVRQRLQHGRYPYWWLQTLNIDIIIIIACYLNKKRLLDVYVCVSLVEILFFIQWRLHTTNPFREPAQLGATPIFSFIICIQSPLQYLCIFFSIYIYVYIYFLSFWHTIYFQQYIVTF